MLMYLEKKLNSRDYFLRQAHRKTGKKTKKGKLLTGWGLQSIPDGL